MGAGWQNVAALANFLVYLLNSGRAGHRPAFAPRRKAGATMLSAIRNPLAGTGLVLAAFAFAWAPRPADAATVTNLTLSTSYDDLAVALAQARDGDTIEVTGTHTGNFIIARPITLVGKTDSGNSAALDGGGRGTVLAIKAEGVIIEELRLEHSGRGSDIWALWGDAGVFVDADKATLRGLTVVDNDWGVVFHGGAGSLIEKSTIEDNVRTGVRVVGGHGHRIVANSVNRNSVGISIDALFAKAERSPLGNLASPDAARLLALQRQVAVRSEDVLVADNDVRGNGSYGIEVAWESKRITVRNNDVYKTGIERPVDQALISAWEHDVSQGAGVAVSLDRTPYGSGIYLFCLVTDSTVVGNRSHDNASAGIGLDLVNDNNVTGNVVSDNRAGIVVSTSSHNTLERNIVSANADYGIMIATATAGAAASSDNLLTLNDMSANRVNAFDSSGRTLTDADILKMIDAMPMLEAAKKQLRTSRQMREMMLKTMRAQLKPATNRWDDGTYGNRYDDFDEVAEGFRDRNQDGIGERAHPIPGGTSVDHYPLSAERVADLRVVD